MNNQAIDVYKHYKSLYGSMLLLFRVRNNYEAYFEDAVKIANNSNYELHTDMGGDTKIVCSTEEIWDLLEILGEKGCICKLIQQRNSSGEYALPDIQRLKSERKMYY